MRDFHDPRDPVAGEPADDVPYIPLAEPGTTVPRPAADRPYEQAGDSRT
jgi:hypothetical protein